MKRIVLVVLTVVVVLAFIIVGGIASFLGVQKETAGEVCKSEVSRWKQSAWTENSKELAPFVDALFAAEQPSLLESGLHFQKLNAFAEFVKVGAQRKIDDHLEFLEQASRLCLREKLAHANNFNHALLEFALMTYLSGEDPNLPLEIVLNRASLKVPGTDTLVEGFLKESRRFYHADLAKLNLQQRALLAGTAKSPSMYDPKTEPEKAKQRRDDVIRRLLKASKITETEAAAAIASPVY